MAPSCSVLHCPAACTCSNNIVDCRGKGLTEIPTNLPETITEMYVILPFFILSMNYAVNSSSYVFIVVICINSYFIIW